MVGKKGIQYIAGQFMAPLLADFRCNSMLAIEQQYQYWSAEKIV
jgi:hypothetical protein